ncbi:MAG: hypothetical protein JNJ78_23475 [Anaerolineae bacterium]|nr:hypothetical protein [Anaerolineae bacterium]
MDHDAATKIKTLGLEALNNSSAEARKRALLELRHYTAPILVDVFERVSKQDRDHEVRDLAARLLSKQRLSLQFSHYASLGKPETSWARSQDCRTSD